MDALDSELVGDLVRAEVRSMFWKGDVWRNSSDAKEYRLFLDMTMWLNDVSDRDFGEYIVECLERHGFKVMRR